MVGKPLLQLKAPPTPPTYPFDSANALEKGGSLTEEGIHCSYRFLFFYYKFFISFQQNLAFLSFYFLFSFSFRTPVGARVSKLSS